MAFSSQSFTAPTIPKLNRGNISSPLSSSASKISGTTPKLKTSRIKFFRPSLKKTNVTAEAITPKSSTENTLAESIKKKSSIESTLVETNRILVEIQKQLAYDFAMRIAEEKEKEKILRKEKSKTRFRMEEGALESVKKIGKNLAKTTSEVLSPVKGFFDKILAFLGFLAKGFLSNAVFSWLSKEENQQKLQKFFNILRENWQLFAKIIATGLFANLALKLVGIAKILGKIFTFLVSPVGLGLLAGLMLAKEGIKFGHHRRKMEEKMRLTQEVSLGIKDPSMIGYKPEDKGMTFEEYKIYNYMEPHAPKGLQEMEVDPRIEINKNRLEEVFSPDYDSMDDVNEIRQWDPNIIDRTKMFFQGFGRREMGGPVKSGQPYIVGEKGPELFFPNIDGSVVNNYRTEKIYEMISKNPKRNRKVNIQTIDLPPIVEPMPDVKVPVTPPPSVPNISSKNALDLWRFKTPEIYGIYV